MAGGKRDIFKALSQLTQVGFTVLTPVVLCILTAGWLMRKFDLGVWIVIVGALLGTASGFMSLYKYCRSIFK